MSVSLVDNIIEALIHVTNQPKFFIPLHAPIFCGNEKKYLADCIDSNFVSSVGQYVDQFEKMLADYTGANRVIVTVNGTAALHTCLSLAGVAPGDEVLVPTFTFVATCNAVSYCGAVPHFVDVEEESLGIDSATLRNYLQAKFKVKDGACYNRDTGAKVSAIVPMHTFGHPVKMEELVKLCDEFFITVIEDAAESLGSYYKGAHTGNFGKMAALSFNGNKIITTGGGGAILTNDEELGHRAKHLTTTAKVPHMWEFNHDRIGFNYRMPALNAALGCAQLEQLPFFLERKRGIAESYKLAFDAVPGAEFFTEPSYAKSNYWLNTVILDPEFAQQRDEVLQRTNNLGIMTRPAWTLMHKLPMFRNCPRMSLTVAESLERRVINIPSSANVGEQFNP